MNDEQNTAPQQQSGLGIAGMVIGIVALLLSCFIVGGFMGIVGIILSILGITQKNKNHGTAIAGTVLNAVAIVIMMIMLLFAIASTVEPDTTTATGKQIEESTAVESSTVAEPLPTVGEYVEGKTWKISLLDAKEYTEIPGEFYSDTPTEGNNYLVLFFEVENISQKDDHFNQFYLESYLDKYATDKVLIINEPEGYDNLTGDVAAGKKLKGYIAYEVPVSGWSELEVSYKDWIGTSNKVATFLVTPENLSE